MKLINPEVRFEVTNLCNARCIMCPREKMKRPLGIMDMKLYTKWLDEAVSLGAKCVSLEHFGEPLLDPGLFEKAAYAKAKGLKVYTITNGSLLGGTAIRSVLKYFDKIRVSMYAVTKETYEKIHLCLSFDDVEPNLLGLFEARKKDTSSNLKIEIYFLMMEENKHEKDLFIERYGKLADGISVWSPHNWSDGRAYRPVLCSKRSCDRPMTGPLQIQWDGLVVPCVFDYDNKIVLGDLKKESIRDVLKGPAYESLRLAHTKGEFGKYPLCDGCEQLNKREDVLVFTNIQNSRVGATNTAYFDLHEKKGTNG